MPKRLYDDDGHWLDDKEVLAQHKEVEKKLRKLIKDLDKAGWARIDVERMLFDVIRFESTMYQLEKTAKASEKAAKRMARK